MNNGGLETDGQSVDPVSGNEIPLGSSAENVRDDVDAKLSEGEYVMPADVVKFFGVQHFEKLIQKAKAGMEEMQANGRVGGEDPEMANGGYIPGSNMDSITDRIKASAEADPSAANMLKAKGIFVSQGHPSDQQARGPEVKGESTPRQYAEGGEVPQSGFNPYAHTPGFSAQTGQTGQAPGVAPQVAAPVCPEGYVWNPETNVCEPVAGEQEVAAGSSTSSRNQQVAKPAVNPNAWMEQFNYNDADELFAQTMSSISTGTEGSDENGGLLSNLTGLLAGGLAGGVLGKFMGATTSARAAANAITLRAMDRGDLADQLEAQNGTYVEQNGLSMIPESWRDGDQLALSIAEVKSAVLDAAPSTTSSSSAPASVSSGTTATTTAAPAGGRSDAARARSGRATTSNVAAHEPIESAPAPSAPEGLNATSTPTSASRAASMTAVRDSVPDKVAAGLSGSQMRAGTDVGANEDGSDYVGAFNKGGLVSKRKTKTKTKGGLGRKQSK